MRGDHVIVAPPYTVSEVELRDITGVLRAAYDVEEAAIDRLQAKF